MIIWRKFSFSNKFKREGLDESKPVDIHIYEPILKDISATSDGILLKQDRVIILSSLKDKIISLAHSGHQGIVKTVRCFRKKNVLIIYLFV